MKTDKECTMCIHKEVCKTAESCDGFVSGCKYFKEQKKGQMDMKEKLVELFNEAEEHSADICCFNSTCEDCPGNKYENKCRDHLKADYLIAHGVVISNLETTTWLHRCHSLDATAPTAEGRMIMAETKLEICRKCWGTGHIHGGDKTSTWSKTCEDCHGIGFVRVPQTNADRIRAMSDEELAEFVSNCGCPDHARSCIASCTDCTLKWLKQPADMGGEEDA